MNDDQINKAARAIHSLHPSAYRWDEIPEETRDKFRAEAVVAIAAFHGKVSSADEIESLPALSVVSGKTGPFIKGHSGRWYKASRSSAISSALMASLLPNGDAYTILREGPDPLYYEGS